MVLRAKIKNKQARNAFAARHNWKKDDDRLQQHDYWSCNLPRYDDQLGLGSKNEHILVKDNPYTDKNTYKNIFQRRRRNVFNMAHRPRRQNSNSIRRQRMAIPT